VNGQKYNCGLSMNYKQTAVLWTVFGPVLLPILILSESIWSDSPFGMFLFALLVLSFLAIPFLTPIGLFTLINKTDILSPRDQAFSRIAIGPLFILLAINLALLFRPIPGVVYFEGPVLEILFAGVLLLYGLIFSVIGIPKGLSYYKNKNKL